MSNTNIDKNNSVLNHHMQQLGDQRNEVFKAFHSFENRYLYGGMIALIALLNTDLIFFDNVKSKELWIIASVFIVAYLISAIYFWRVYERLCNHHLHFRSIKYHYELTYYAVLLDAKIEDYLSWLERSLLPEEKSQELNFPEEVNFSCIAEYLHRHHMARVKNRAWIKNYILLPLLLVFILLIVKVVIYAA